MELVVVLTILIGLAAIVVPMFPNLLRRTHKATDSTQTNEVAKAIQLYQGLYVSYPDQFDLLTDSTGSSFASFLPGGGTAPFGNTVTLTGLSADQAAALGRVGINFGWTLASGTTPPAQPTLDPYTAATGGTNGARVALASGTKVALLTPGQTAGIPTEIQRIYNSDNTARFVVFGVGQRCTAVGTVMQNAPTSVPQEKGFTPDNTYCRVGVIFQIDGIEVVKSERARFIMAVALEDDELESTEKDIVGYYNVAASP